MAFGVTCPTCGKAFSITDEIYQRKVASRVVTIKCKQCQAGIRVDATNTQAPKISAAAKGPGADDKGIETSSAAPAVPPAPRVRQPTLIGGVTTHVKPVAAAAPAPAPAPTATATPAATAAPTETLWAVEAVDGQDRELTLAELGREIERGGIALTALVWREGMADWLEVQQVPELASHVKKVAARKVPAPAAKPAPAALAPKVTAPAAGAAMATTPAARAKMPSAPMSAEAPTLPRPAVAARDSKPSFEDDDDDDETVIQPMSAALRRQLAAATAQRTPAATPAGRATPTPAERVTPAPPQPARVTPPPPEPQRVTPPPPEPQRVTPPPPEPARVTPPPAPSAATAPEPVRATPPAAPPLAAPPPLLATPPAAAPAAPQTFMTPGPVAASTDFDLPPVRSKAPLVVAIIAVLGAAAAAFFLLRSNQPELPPPAPVAEAPAVSTATAATPKNTSGTATAMANDSETQPSATGATETTPGAGFAELFASGARRAEGVEPSARFDAAIAKKALEQVLPTVAQCKEPGGPRGKVSATVAFAPTGKVSSVTISEPPFAGTSTASCLSEKLKRASMPPFKGLPGTLSQAIYLQ